LVTFKSNENSFLENKEAIIKASENMTYSEFLKHKIRYDGFDAFIAKLEEFKSSDIPERKESAEKVLKKIAEFNATYEKDTERNKPKQEIMEAIEKTINNHAKTGNLEEFKKLVETFDIRSFPRKDRVKKVKLPDESNYQI
jgi:hypothetical protein